MSGNPNPQHNPTDGLGVAAYVQVTGTGITNCSGGSGSAQGTNGQGIGAVPSTNHPSAQYALTLSIAGTAPNAATCQLTTVLKDVANTTYTPVGSPVYKSYNNPSGGFYRPSVFVAVPAYSGAIASVSGSGLITALAIGQAVIEVQFATFDDVMTPQTDATTGNPTMMIYAQILVTVVP